MSQILIIGGHRCGTSLAARLVASTGVHMGTDLIGANESNPFGHFEDRQFVSLHEGILNANNMNWYSTEGEPTHVPIRKMLELRNAIHLRETSRSAWGLKDPRICNFLPLWEQHLPAALRVLVIRRPWDASTSMLRRHMMDFAKGRGEERIHNMFWQDPNLALKIWLHYNQKILNYALSTSRKLYILNYERRQTWGEKVTQIALEIGLPINHEINIADYLDEGLGSERLGLTVSDAKLESEADAVWSRLQKLEY